MNSSQRHRADIRVLIADDHAVVREGIRHVLTSEEGFAVVGEAATGNAAVEMAARVSPDVVVLDLSMPGMSGLEAAARILEVAPRARLLILSMHTHQEYVQRSVRAGVAGYVRKDSSPSELRVAVRAVFDGGTYFSSSVDDDATGRPVGSAHREDERLAALTSRERDVLLQIARGASNKETASRLGISVRTVETHRESVARKLGVKGAASLARFAIESGLLDTE